ncbi:DEAD/DEAH box helicase family protein [uncultured Vibrio sp.]|uniref:DEAD/DEAH box helicase n=1 Tax=uncultured Vibrio sp. TaxID=114054 RepID=UPI0025EFF2C0|nr:DEAD/DEAH box helicase family protein [uncultured Vibrio sp.]
MLREWQSNCVEAALNKYTNGGRNFFCQATPGAGKTVMAAELAKRLFEEGDIDLVLCFSPSLTVAEGIRSTFAWKLGCAFNGGMGTLGASYTYQSIQFFDESFWQTMRKFRILAVFDEVHHCSYDEHGNMNSWGEQVVSKIQSLAYYTLALSGTPWRSDLVSIAMAEYSDPEGEIICDFQYGLKQAIEEKVCRTPKIALVDNDHLSVTEGNETKSFTSILELLKQSKTSYQSVIYNEGAMRFLLEVSCKKLAEIRCTSPNAGGLVVAASIQHAKQIQTRLIEEFQQTTCIVTHHHDDPLAEIERFRKSSTQWIVSVGMISEGTDIPRLQVCCHISAVKTELYFRQVLGRILRINDAPNQEAWLFTFAEENLTGFAERIEQDIPDTCMYIKQERDTQGCTPSNEQKPLHTVGGNISNLHQRSILSWGEPETLKSFNATNLKSSFEELRLGQFRQRVISAFT